MRLRSLGGKVFGGAAFWFLRRRYTSSKAWSAVWAACSGPSSRAGWPCRSWRFFASGHGLQVAGGTGVDAQRHLEGFALKTRRVGGQQVLEDTALERAEHRAKQVGYRPASCSSTGWGCGALATPGAASGVVARVQGCGGAGACRHGAGTAPVAAASTDAGAGEGDEESADMVVAIRPQAGCSSGREKTTRIIPDFL